MRDIWLSIYRQSQEHFDLYELTEELVDVEDWFQQWRFRHMKTVERIIGNKPGTGGSSGVGLKTALERSFFPEPGSYGPSFDRQTWESAKTLPSLIWSSPSDLPPPDGRARKATPQGQVERLGANEGRGPEASQAHVGYFA